MRFYAHDRTERILLPLLNLVVCALQVRSTLHHPSTEHTAMSLCWGFITLLNVMTFWGTYWRITPQGLLESRLFARRVIPYNIIRDVSRDGSLSGRWDSRSIRVSILLDKPLLARPAEYERFVSGLEQHLDPVLIHL